MKITKYVVGPRDPRPKVCRFCHARLLMSRLKAQRMANFTFTESPSIKIIIE